MNPSSYNEAINLLTAYLNIICNKTKKYSILDSINFIIAPPAVYLHSIYLELKNLNYHNDIYLCAQNISWEKQGALTGELSAYSLKSIGCEHAIIGHSERRLYNYETDDLIARKFSIALAAGLTPIVCVGETKAEFDNKDTWKVLDRQLNFLKNIITAKKDCQQYYFIAYEPVWAIGSSYSADLAYIEQVNNYILNMFASIDCAAIKILYGGSVNANNAKQIISIANNDGLLIGGASLDVGQFSQVCENIV